MRLPNIANTQIDIAKLAGYVLNTHHPEGRHKARVFLSALGLTAHDAHWLADAIRERIPATEAVLQEDTRWGAIYRVDVDIMRGARCAKVRTGWLCTQAAAKLVTCFVMGDCDETA